MKSLSRLCADYLIILLILRSVIALRVINKLRALEPFTWNSLSDSVVGDVEDPDVVDVVDVVVVVDDVMTIVVVSSLSLSTGEVTSVTSLSRFTSWLSTSSV